MDTSEQELAATEDISPVHAIAKQAELLRQQIAASGHFASLGPFSSDDSRLDAILTLFEKTQAGSITEPHSDNPHVQHEQPKQIGRFRIISVLGVGGFATVYQAHDDVLLRDVALKSVRRRSASTGATQDATRLHEARAAARLSHPNLVPLYEVFQDDQAVYLVSELCQGSTLADWLSTHPGPVTPELTCTTCLDLAEAIDHVHQRGLVHRDIKPGNIMISESVGGDGALKLRPRLTDFGLVRDLLADSELSKRYRLVGTLLYMAPEQVLANEQKHGEACDIFALGVLFYRMLTGHLPHRGDDPMSLFRSICVKPPARPRQLVANIPRDLEAICLKCLAKDPTRRYASATALRDDLYRWQQGLMVEARPRSLFERTWHAVKRSPMESGLLATIILLLFIGAAVLARSNRRLTDHQRKLETALSDVTASERRAVNAQQKFREQRDLALATEHRAMQTAYMSDLRHAYDSLARNNLSGALNIAESIEQYATGKIPIQLDLKILKSQAKTGWSRLPGFNSPVRGIHFFPDQARFISIGEENAIRIHRRADGKVEQEIPQPTDTRRFAIEVSPDGKLLAIGNQVGQKQGWRDALNQVDFYSLSDQPAPKPLTDLPTTVESLAFSRDGKLLAIGCRYQPIKIIELQTAMEIATLDASRRNHDVKFSRDGKQILYLHEKSGAHWVDWATRKVSSEAIFEHVLHRFDVSDDGRWFVSCNPYIPMLHLSDMHNPDREPVALLHSSGWGHCVAISADGRRVVAGMLNGSVVSWDLSGLLDPSSNGLGNVKKWRHNDSRILHGGTVTEIAINAAGEIISGGEDGSIARTTFKEPLIHPLQLAQRTICGTLAPDGKTAYISCADLSVLAVDTASLSTEVLARFRSDDQAVVLQASDDGRWLGIGTETGDLTLVDLQSPKRRFHAKNPDFVQGEVNNVMSIQFSPDNDRLLLSTAGGTYLAFYSVPADGDTELELVDQKVLPVSHREIILLDRSRCIMFGDTISQYECGASEVTHLRRGMSRFQATCYAFNSKSVFSASKDNRIRRHDHHGAVVQTSTRWNPPPGKNPVVFEMTELVLTPDKRCLVTGASDGSIAIWNADDLRFLGFIVVGTGDGEGKVSDIKFSHDGKTWFYNIDNPEMEPATRQFQINTIQ